MIATARASVWQAGTAPNVNEAMNKGPTSEDGVVGSVYPNGIDGIGADQLACFIDFTAEIVPSNYGLDRGADVAARHFGSEQGIAEPGE